MDNEARLKPEVTILILRDLTLELRHHFSFLLLGLGSLGVTYIIERTVGIRLSR